METPSLIFRFGPFEARTCAQELSKNGTAVRLRGQPFAILELLVSRAGEVVTREEIRQKVWPVDTFVDFEHGLNTSIKKLRQALCDSATEPRYIETLPRLGYRFIAPVETTVEAKAKRPTERRSTGSRRRLSTSTCGATSSVIWLVSGSSAGFPFASWSDAGF